MFETSNNRNVKPGHVIHHIDGVKTNNLLENLVEMTVEEHNRCHAEYELIIFELVKQGIVLFNRESNRYELKNA